MYCEEKKFVREKFRKVLCICIAFLAVVIIGRLETLIGIKMESYAGSLLAVGVFIAFYSAYVRIKPLTRKDWFCFSFLLCLFYAELIGFYVAGDGVRNRHDFSYFYCILSFVLCILLSLPLASAAEEMAERLPGCVSGRSGKKWTGKKGFLKYFLLFMIFWSPFYAAFFPGVYCYDIPWQWRQYLGHSYATWNPVLHSFLFGAICDLGNFLTGGGADYNSGLALYSLLQLAAVAVSLAWGCVFIEELGIPGRMKCLMSFFFALFPIFPLLGISTTKDTLFSVIFTIAAVQLMKLCHIYKPSDKLSRKTAGAAAGCAAWMVLMSLFRNNAVYGMLAAAILLGVFGVAALFFGRKMLFHILGRSSAALLIAAALAALAGTAVVEISHAAIDNTGEILSVPGQQMARVYNYQYENLTEGDLQRIEFYYFEDALRAYVPDIADPVKNGWDHEAYEKETAGYYRLWIEMGMRYPKEYIVAFLLNTQGLWHMGDVTSAGIREAWVELGFWKPVDEEHLVYEHSLFPSFKDLVLEWNSERNFQKIPIVSVLFAPAVYNWLILFAMLIAAVGRKWPALIPGIFILGYGLTLLFGPCTLPRYCLPMAMTAPIYFLFVLKECSKKERV